MKYRLIRFSPNGEVALDKKLPAPNAAGDNVIWQQAYGGTAMLYDYDEKRWYELNTQKAVRVGVTWTYFNTDKQELPKYINMLSLVGAL